MRKMKLSAMVLDFDLYPRSSINTHHVAELGRAVEGGAELPPIVVCKKSKRIADGFHRYRLYVRLYGDDHEVDVVEKSYRDDKELFLDAVRFNAHHGLRMDTHDMMHAGNRAAELGIDTAALAGALQVNPKWLGDMQVDRSATAGGVQVALKRTIRHMAGRKLTKPQVVANEKLSGMNQVFYVNQLITLIESNLLDTGNEELMQRLQHLGELIAATSVAA
jgi:hypothetical protein